MVNVIWTFDGFLPLMVGSEELFLESHQLKDVLAESTNNNVKAVTFLAILDDVPAMPEPNA